MLIHRSSSCRLPSPRSKPSSSAKAATCRSRACLTSSKIGNRQGQVGQRGIGGVAGIVVGLAPLLPRLVILGDGVAAGLQLGGVDLRPLLGQGSSVETGDEERADIGHGRAPRRRWVAAAIACPRAARKPPRLRPRGPPSRRLCHGPPRRSFPSSRGARLPGAPSLFSLPQISRGRRQRRRGAEPPAPGRSAKPPLFTAKSKTPADCSAGVSDFVGWWGCPHPPLTSPRERRRGS